MQNHCKFRYQLQKNLQYDPKITGTWCKFRQTWLIVIWARYCIFENRYWIFRGNKNVWRYRKVRLFRHIREKHTRWAFYPDGRFAPRYPINAGYSHAWMSNLTVRRTANANADGGMPPWRPHPGLPSRYLIFISNHRCSIKARAPVDFILCRPTPGRAPDRHLGKAPR